jgi:DNA modification methylase
MVADELALSLVEKYVPSKSRVLDPFCGSGRLLAAVEDAELRVGVDANPLAWLLTKTKLASIDNTKITYILNSIDIARSRTSPDTYLSLATDRK